MKKSIIKRNSKSPIFFHYLFDSSSKIVNITYREYNEKIDGNEISPGFVDFPIYSLKKK